MSDKLKAALEKGFENFSEREQNLQSIWDLIYRVADVIHEMSEQKAELVTREKVDNLYAIRQHLLGKDDVAELKSSNRKLILRIVSIEDEKIFTDLTILEINHNGFPCSLTIGGNDYSARDIETLEDYFVDLLGSYKTVEAIKKAQNVDQD